VERSLHENSSMMILGTLAVLEAFQFKCVVRFSNESSVS
jgi:hypothetical protein